MAGTITLPSGTQVSAHYSGKILKQRIKDGKEVDPIVAQRTKELYEALSRMSTPDIEKAKLVYGFLLVRGRMNYRDISTATGHGVPWVSARLEHLKSLELVESEKCGNYNAAPVEWYALPDVLLPDEWNVTEIMKIAKEYVVETPAKKNHAGAGTMAILNDAIERDKPILENSAITYENWMTDLRALPTYGVKEIDDIMKECIHLAQKRLLSVRCSCPICGGRIISEGASIRCTACNIAITTRSRQDSLDALKLIADSRKPDTGVA